MPTAFAIQPGTYTPIGLGFQDSLPARLRHPGPISGWTDIAFGLVAVEDGGGRPPSLSSSSSVIGTIESSKVANRLFITPTSVSFQLYNRLPSVIGCSIWHLVGYGDSRKWVRFL